ncbi:MAG: pectinacetylesterase family protein [Polyangiaceae bacterium]|jgi:hypothetical protein|nr:pectinacetylesterase family protein [Polyangiaceae bacterium]
MRRLSVLLLGSCLSLLACEDEEPPSSSSNNGTSGQSGASLLPRLADLKEGELTKIETGGETICARGTPFAFYVQRGTSNKVIVEFSGGGACWDALTCGIGDALFSDEVIQPTESDLRGFYDHSNPKHPMRDWTHVFIPYCTGDIHWGDSDTTYGTGEKAVTINHKGAINSKVVLDWVYANFEAPEKAFVTGCSAGSYGSILWSAHLKEHYKGKGTKLYQFGDSGAGVITDDFFKLSFPSWRPQQHFPGWLGVDFEQLDRLSSLYNTITKAYPQDRFAQFNYRYDDTQVFFFTAMGGKDKDGWNEGMRASLKEIREGSPNFRYFLPEGKEHCTLPYDRFYTDKVGDRLLVDWLDDYVNDRPVEDQACEGCAP